MYYTIADYNIQEPERVFIFECQRNNRTKFTLASNCAYEFWLDDKLLGTGGHRCTQSEAYSDTWETPTGTLIQVKMHWLHYKKSSVFYRCVFKDSFLADIDNNNTDWICYHDTSITFGEKICSQLSRQNIVLNATKVHKDTKDTVITTDKISWTITPLPVKRSNLISVTPTLTETQTIEPNQKVDPKNKKAKNISTTFNPLRVSDILEYVRDKRYCQLTCDTYDLGYIALHKVFLTTHNSPAVICYSEVPKFEDAWKTSSRRKVHMADAFAQNLNNASPIGFRGFRYIHVLYNPGTTRPQPHAVRSEYPFDWKPLKDNNNPIIVACKNNLIACVDGGLVDTCWRERGQWTGDARMSIKALKALTNNPEVGEFVLRQIADSYDTKTGLVQGAWPVKTPEYKLEMPPYHLAFCLTVVENMPNTDPLYQLVLDSVTFWKKNYLKNGLITYIADWNFIDWDPEDESLAGRGKSYQYPNCVCNVWFDELCALLKVDSGIDHKVFYDTFLGKKGFKLYPNGTDNIHATAAVLSSYRSQIHKYKKHHAKQYLEDYVNNDFEKLKGKVTAYYAYFVAKALDNPKDFINKYYMPIAEELGTIYEKTSSNASRAHGWSVGVVTMLV
jgi:hypothetical protein